MGKELPVEPLRALLLAELHIREARAGASHLSSLKNPPLELRDCLYSGIVISYSRSFGANDGLSNIGARFRHFDDPRFQLLHDAILEARDKIYAHVDLVAPRKKLSSNVSVEEMKKIGIRITSEGKGHWDVMRATLPIARLSEIVALCEFQILRINEASTSMLRHMMQEKAYRPGSYELGVSFP